MKTTAIVLFTTILSIISGQISAQSNVWEGVPLAQFELRDQNNQIKTNKDFTGSWLVLYFYPKNKTPGCTVEAQKFTEDYAKYQALNTNIVGVSYDDVESHQAFASEYEMPFTLLADTNAALSKALNVDRILPWPHASRQTFIVDPQGVIVHHFKEVSPHTHSKEVLTLLREKQQAGKNKSAAS